MSHHLRKNIPAISLLALAALAGLVLLGSNGSFVILGNYAVYDGSTYTYRDNLTSAAGSTWYTGYQQYDYTYNLWRGFVSAWTGSAWGSPAALSPPNGKGADNVNLSWDSVMARPVYTYHDWVVNQTSSSIWFGYYNSATSSWVVGNGGAPVLSSSIGFWDYPSIDVDASGRIIIGAMNRNSPYGFWTVVSTNHGQTFSAVNIGTNLGRVGTGNALLSRTVATNSKFETFVPITASGFTQPPTGIQRYESTDGINWTLTQPNPLFSFTAGMNNSPGTYTTPGTSDTGPIYYSYEIDAHGYTDGSWAVAGQMNVSFSGSPYNNVYLCTSRTGTCSIVNSYPDDQFLASTSMSGDGGVWVSYVTYSTLQTRQLPLITQSIYIPSSGAPIGGTTFNNANPTYWAFDSPNDRCTVSCFDGGDYWRMSSNPYKAGSAPFLVQDTAPLNAVWQSFVEDPQTPMQPYAFTPNLISFPLGSDVSSLGSSALPASAVGPTLAVLPPRRAPGPVPSTPPPPAPPQTPGTGAPIP